MARPPALPWVDAPPTAAVAVIFDVSNAWTLTLRPLTTVSVFVAVPSPIAAVTEFSMVLIVAPPCPASFPVDRPKPIVTDWIFEESSAVTSTSPVVTVSRLLVM